MFKDGLLETLNRSKTNKKRLSSEEFRKVYDNLWKEGPKIKYQSPDAWRKAGERANKPDWIFGTPR